MPSSGLFRDDSVLFETMTRMYKWISINFKLYSKTNNNWSPVNAATGKKNLSKISMQPKNNHFQRAFTQRMVIKWTKSIRSRQDSNLRGGTPLDFKSNALTTRPRLLICFTDASLTISRFPSEYFYHRAPQPRLFDKKQTDAFTRQKIIYLWNSASHSELTEQSWN